MAFGYRAAARTAHRLLYGGDRIAAAQAARRAEKLAPRRLKAFWRGVLDALEDGHVFKQKRYSSVIVPTELVEEIESVFKESS